MKSSKTSDKSVPVPMAATPSTGPHFHDTTVFALGTVPSQAITPVKGTAFRTQLRELAAGTRSAVLLGATLPVRYSSPWKKPNLDKSLSHQIDFSYSRTTHASIIDQTQWTQGWLHPGGGTKYTDVLPKDLSLADATSTVRAMKAIMGHTPKPLDFPSLTTMPAVNLLARGATKPAALSFVEDVTGELGAATRHTGSALRAMYLRAKLSMKNVGATEATGFQNYAMGKLTQLNEGGAVQLAKTISEEKKKGSSTIATSYAATVKQEHDLLHDTVKARFQKKHTEYMGLVSKSTSPSTIRAQLGDWWADADRSDASASLDLYARHKYAKHGIGDWT